MSMAVSGNTLELFNFINNDAILWRSVETYYKIAEERKNKDEYVPEYLEASLIFTVNVAARKYVRAYCPRSTVLNDMFSFDIRRECAKYLVDYFETEIDLGNGWLG